MGPFHILLDEMGLEQMGLDKVGRPQFTSSKFLTNVMEKALYHHSKSNSDNVS